jgi:hypothetical protein
MGTSRGSSHMHRRLRHKRRNKVLAVGKRLAIDVLGGWTQMTTCSNYGIEESCIA